MRSGPSVTTGPSWCCRCTLPIAQMLPGLPTFACSCSHSAVDVEWANLFGLTAMRLVSVTARFTAVLPGRRCRGSRAPLAILPDRDRHGDRRVEREDDQLKPDLRQPRALHQHGARDRNEMPDRVELRQDLH